MSMQGLGTQTVIHHGGESPSHDKGAPTGKHSNATEQGIITVTAHVDKRTLEATTNLSRLGRPLFPTAEDAASQDILDGEPVFRMKTPRNAMSENPHGLHVMSSLNGMGVDAVEAFPEDEEMAALEVRNRIEFAGFARYDVARDNLRQGLAVQISGIVTSKTRYDMPPGSYVRIVVPLPKDLGRPDRKRYENVPTNKVTIELRPYKWQTIEFTVAAHMRNYLSEPGRYKRTMSVGKVKTTNAWINFMESIMHNAIVTWGLVTSHLAQRQIIKPIEFGGALTNAEDRDALAQLDGELATGDDVMLFITKGLGSLAISNVNTINPKLRFTPKHEGMFAALRRETLQKVFYDGTIMNLEFGSQNGSNPRAKDFNGRPKVDAPYGRMLSNQLNHFPATVIAFAQVAQLDRSDIISKVVKGAQENMPFDHAMP